MSAIIIEKLVEYISVVDGLLLRGNPKLKLIRVVFSIWILLATSILFAYEGLFVIFIIYVSPQFFILILSFYYPIVSGVFLLIDSVIVAAIILPLYYEYGIGAWISIVGLLSLPLFVFGTCFIFLSCPGKQRAKY